MSYRSGGSDGDSTGGPSGSSESSSESSDEPEQSSQPAPASVKKQRRYTCDLCRARKVRLDCSLADSFDRTNAKNQKPRLQCLDRPSGKCTRPPRTSPPSAGPQQEDAGCCGWIIGTRGGVCVAPPPAPHQRPSSAPLISTRPLPSPPTGHQFSGYTHEGTRCLPGCADAVRAGGLTCPAHIF